MRVSVCACCLEPGSPVPPCTACRLRMLDSWKGTLLWRASWCICAAGPALSVRAPPRKSVRHHRMPHHRMPLHCSTPSAYY